MSKQNSAEILCNNNNHDVNGNEGKYLCLNLWILLIAVFLKNVKVESCGRLQFKYILNPWKLLNGFKFGERGQRHKF